MNGFITVKEAAEKWNIGVRRVNTLCLEGRIPGVSKLGNVWATRISHEMFELWLYE